jgi:uncharacterized protein (DUF58 family)
VIAGTPVDRPRAANVGPSCSRAGAWTTTDRGKATTWFVVDRALAAVLAAAWKLLRRDRTRHGDSLIGHWRAKQQRTKVGDPIELEVEIRNRGNRPATVTFGPLASSFAFVVPGVPAITPVFTGRPRKTHYICVWENKK